MNRHPKRRTRRAAQKREGRILLAVVYGALLAWLVAFLLGCAGPGERWACRAADGSVVTCRTVPAP